MQADDKTIDEIIERVTVDAYGDEGYSLFAQAFEDEVDFSLDATLFGVNVEIGSVDFDADERRGLIAVITNGGETHRALSSASCCRPVRRCCSPTRTGDGSASAETPETASAKTTKPFPQWPGLRQFLVATATTTDLRVGSEVVKCR